MWPLSTFKVPFDDVPFKRLLILLLPYSGVIVLMISGRQPNIILQQPIITALSWGFLGRTTLISSCATPLASDWSLPSVDAVDGQKASSQVVRFMRWTQFSVKVLSVLKFSETGKAFQSVQTFSSTFRHPPNRRLSRSIEIEYGAKHL